MQILVREIWAGLCLSDKLLGCARLLGGRNALGLGHFLIAGPG